MTAIQKRGPVIAIDGPAGTGKSTVTRRLSEKLGFVHIDTGSLYRAIAYLCLERRTFPDARLTKDITDEEREGAVQVAREAHLIFQKDSRKTPSNRIIANGKDITDSIRTPQVSLGASFVSSIPGVRAALLGIQRRLGCGGRALLEGRDIGTVVFPDADIKFFMTASLEERAKRRLAEWRSDSVNIPPLDEIKAQMMTRDEQDRNRKVAPLKKSDDSIEIDTTLLTLDEVVEKMEGMIRTRIQC